MQATSSPRFATHVDSESRSEPSQRHSPPIAAGRIQARQHTQIGGSPSLSPSTQEAFTHLLVQGLQRRRVPPLPIGQSNPKANYLPDRQGPPGQCPPAYKISHPSSIARHAPQAPSSDSFYPAGLGIQVTHMSPPPKAESIRGLGQSQWAMSLHGFTY